MRPLALIIPVLLMPSASLADGLFVWRNEALDIHEPEQKALVCFHDGWEDLVLAVRFEGAAEEFGWIVPTPTVPEMAPEEISLFEHLSRVTQDRQSRRSERGAKLRMTAGMDVVEIVRQQTVGIYEATVLRSGSAAGLGDWLRANEYRLPPGAEPIIKRYVDDGWVFAALKLRPGAADSAASARLAAGTIQPIRFHFRCERPVFPLAISSLGGEPSDVLLYVLSPEVVVPAGGAESPWDSQIYSQAGERHWIFQYKYDSGRPGFLPDWKAPFFLSKNRARLEPAQMKDVFFVPYDPKGALGNSNPAVRAEAAVFLGDRKPENADRLLLEFLRGASEEGEISSVLWALGEVGGKAAEEAVLARMEHPDYAIRIEAAEALGRMGSRKALPAYVQGLVPAAMDGSAPEAKPAEWTAAAFQRSCFDQLVRRGDRSCQSALRRIEKEYGGRSAWSRGGLGSSVQAADPGVLALAALAACGDRDSYRTVMEGLVAGSDVTTPARLQARSRQRGSYNWFPSGFWAGAVARSRLLHNREWASVARVHDLFSANPPLRDRIYREAAHSRAVPAAGAALLLSGIEVPTDDDLRLARRLWEAAVRDPGGIIEVTTEAGDVAYNMTACLVVYAFTGWKRVDLAGGLLDTAPPSDEVLRGEIVTALASSEDSSYVPVVARYVQEIWDRNAKTAAFRDALRKRADRERSRGKAEGPSMLLIAPQPFDLEYRVRPVLRYLSQHLPEAQAQAMVADSSLSPYLRMRLIVEMATTCLSRVPVDWGRDQIHRMTAEANPDDDLLTLYAEPVLAMLDRLEALRRQPATHR